MHFVLAKNNKYKPLTKEDMIELLNQMNFASKNDLHLIAERLKKLEQKVTSQG
jgi:hypothetical protein